MKSKDFSGKNKSVDHDAAVSYREWLMRKELLDKGIEIFAKLDPGRASDDDDFREVSISLCAIDRLLGVDDLKPSRTLNTQEETEKGTDEKIKKPQKSMRSSWLKWTMEHHSYSMVVLSEDDVAPLSGGAKEFLEKTDAGYVLMTLKYNFPAVPKKPNEKPKPLTNDQKLQNAFFLRECKKSWREAKQELMNRIKEEIVRRREEVRSKGGGRSGNSQLGISAEADAKFDKTTERMTLMALSLGKLKEWVEADEDKAITEAKSDAQEQQRQAKQAHEQFVKAKDGLRIYLPPPEVLQAIKASAVPRSFSVGRTNPVQPRGKGAETTAELALMGDLLEPGRRFIHATKKGRGMVDGDLEKSRKALLSRGYVDVKNFDDGDDTRFPRTDFKKHVRENPVLRERKQKEKVAKVQSEKAFEEWLQNKAMREQAEKMFSLIDPPVPQPSRNSWMGTSTAATSTSLARSANQSTLGEPPNLSPGSGVSLALTVGKALKRVDRNLYQDWARWAAPVLTPNVAAVLWDFFPPMACDVHGAVYSQVKEAFLKLLRPGIDFKAAFREVVEKTHRRASDGMAGPDAEEEKKKIAEELKLSKKQMHKLLVDLGIAMRSDEIDVLVDAFDKNGDGSITLAEVAEFTGPIRTKNSGVSTALEKRCCWRTTCFLTGMPNAFSGSHKEESAKEKQSKAKASTSPRPASANKTRSQEQESKRKDAGAEPTGRLDPSSERQKRIDILLRYGLIDKAQVKEQLDRDGAHSGGDDSSPTKGGNSTGSERCQFITWTSVEAKEGLRVLAELTKAAREEETLKQLMKDGQAPGPPRFWSAGLDDEDIGSGDEELTTFLLLRWAPRKEELVSFYSLETSGQSGRGTGELKYKEIFRDPPDAFAEEAMKLKYRIENLTPATSYQFRIRAFNGFGPGEYTYGTFTTRPRKPDTPKTVSIAPDSVTIRWVFSREYLRRIAELRCVFELADKDKNGTISRSELASKFDEVEEQEAAAAGERRGVSSDTRGELDVENILAESARAVGPRSGGGLDTEMILFESAGGVLSAKEREAYRVERDYTGVIVSEVLARMKRLLGIPPHERFRVVFDRMDSDDNNNITWDEFQQFFLDQGWGSTSPIGADTNSQMNASASLHFTRKSMASTGGVGGGSGGGGGGQNFGGRGVQYLIQKCESEWEGVYLDIMRTYSGSATISRLNPGQAYRFAVIALNADGMESSRSDSVVVHTYLETPPEPTVATVTNVYLSKTDIPAADLAVTPRQMTVTWKGRNHAMRTRDKAYVEKVIGQWALSHEEEGGISIESAFANYDRDRSGTIDASELEKLLIDLGVEPTKERLEEAFDLIDKDGSGTISFDEFSQWWRRDEVSYVLKRSDPVPPKRSLESAVAASTNAMSKAEIGRTEVFDKSKTRPRSSFAGRSMVSASSNALRKSVSINPDGSVTTGTVLGAIMKSVQTTGAYRAVDVPYVSYLGSGKRCEVAGLEPNTLYHFRLRYTGSRTHSQLSPPLIIMTAPLPPPPPVLCRLGATSVRVKWYPPTNGAHKFILQSQRGGRQSGEPFETKYIGPETTWMGVCLVPDTVYSIRVSAMSYQGTSSAPSLELQFKTRPRSENKEMLTSKNANVHFKVESTSDICVGDTILFSERLFAKDKSGRVDVVAADKGASGIQRGMQQRQQTPIRTRGETVVRMDMSVTSVHSTAPSVGAFIGERIVAAHVLRDNYRGARGNDWLKDRLLWLEVVWQRATPEDKCHPYDLQPGEVIERKQSHLEQFEVFRCPWAQEEGRKPLKAELALLEDCYWPSDCPQL